MPPTQQQLPDLGLGHHPDHGTCTPTITQRFHAFDTEHPWIYVRLQSLVARRLAAGATRIGMKALFEALRWQQPSGVKGLNNNYTALYARRLITDHPEWASAIEIRRRRSP
ncbi:hypothetical protein [Streptomyces sp. NPDC026589]|uniref:hypothetical protein n=1 Tax=Streptomyces TaxID=1883 RepID=UPI0033CB8B86|nr:hypothetical protein OHB50_31095 [Streptomyces anulatus]